MSGTAGQAEIARYAQEAIAATDLHGAVVAIEKFVAGVCDATGEITPEERLEKIRAKVVEECEYYDRRMQRAKLDLADVVMRRERSGT